jgi:hypothetical protein
MQDDAPLAPDAVAAKTADATVAARTPTSGHVAGLGVLLAFTATTFLSAVLLFSVQPMFAKMVLPLLGGSPSVWAVALLFFQGALLVGYAYAHLLMAKVAARATGFVHLALSATALLVLPIGLPAGWPEPPPGDPYFWQLGLFTVAIGLPFVAVAANAPLLQAWFARTGHPSGSDPYFLYAASNLGSLLALLGYPFVLEPVFGLRVLATLWTAGFVVLLAALGACFWLVRRAGDGVAGGVRAAADTAPDIAPDTTPDWSARARWVGLALVPSALLTAFTTHIATDVASAPLIWVIPLALYLLTFVIVFRERALIPRPLLLLAHLVAVILALLQLGQTKEEKWPLLATLGVAAFVTSALVAHRTLYESRPGVRHLTEFYMWMSVGGVLGGLFSALIAPKIFPEVFEYPLLLALSFACRPGALDFSPGVKDALKREAAWIAGILIFGLLAIYWVPRIAAAYQLGFDDYGSTPVVVLILGAASVLFWFHPKRQLAAALLMFLAVVLLPSSVHRGEAQRSYFGVYRVILSDDLQFNVLQHGTTLHGAQRIRDANGRTIASTTPATYYHPHSPMAQAVRIVGTWNAQRGEEGRFGVIGLGTGSMACHSASGETWRFFEIDPLVVSIAKSPHFTYLANCQPNADIVLGDARLTLAKEKDESFDLLVVDAFSSDAIPMHLLTREAIRIYAAKLKPHGAGVLHISNRYLDLEAVLGPTLQGMPDLKALVVEDPADDGYAVTSSTVVVFGKGQEAIDAFRAVPGARDIKESTLRPWTDDASDILGPFLSKYDKRRHKRAAGPGQEVRLVAPDGPAR